MSAPTRAPDQIVEWLDGADVDPSRVGGKGASLNRLVRAGFRVPPGFCLTVDAYRTQLATTSSSGRSEGGPANDRERSALVDAITAGPLAPGVRDAIGPALDRLATASVDPSGDPARLAVRSSAVAEDGAAASYAGLHDTELGVGRDEVGAAVLRCWASLWSDRAVAYRTRRGLPLDGGAMAVVVQALVPARSAAVAFTRHPVTGRDDQIVINAVPGLGEAMVSGTVTPDTIVADKSTRTVVEWTPGESGEGPALADDALAELIELCLAVESAYGAPVDIEAASASDGWYLLQARPITTG